MWIFKLRPSKENPGYFPLSRIKYVIQSGSLFHLLVIMNITKFPLLVIFYYLFYRFFIEKWIFSHIVFAFYFIKLSPFISMHDLKNKCNFKYFTSAWKLVSHKLSLRNEIIIIIVILRILKQKVASLNL